MNRRWERRRCSAWHEGRLGRRLGGRRLRGRVRRFPRRFRRRFWRRLWRWQSRRQQGRVIPVQAIFLHLLHVCFAVTLLVQKLRHLSTFDRGPHLRRRRFLQGLGSLVPRALQVLSHPERNVSLGCLRIVSLLPSRHGCFRIDAVDGPVDSGPHVGCGHFLRVLRSDLEHEVHTNEFVARWCRRRVFGRLRGGRRGRVRRGSKGGHEGGVECWYRCRLVRRFECGRICWCIGRRRRWVRRRSKRRNFCGTRRRDM